MHDELELSGLIRLYALISTMRVLSSPTVVEHALIVVRTITATYTEPHKTPAELDEMIKSGGGDLLLSFSELCRKELESRRST